MLPKVTNEPEFCGVLRSDTELENKLEHARSAADGRRTGLVTSGKREWNDLARLRVTGMILNQLRHKIGVTFGSPETTTGGNALKFYASMRLDVRRIAQVKIGDEPVGGRTRVKLAKNKCAPPFTEAEFDIRWGTGVDGMAELLDLGVARGLVDKSGNHMSFAAAPLGNGRERARETLAGSVELQNTLRQAIIAAGPVRPGRRTAEA
jgi:recombination protein RecA